MSDNSKNSNRFLSCESLVDLDSTYIILMKPEILSLNGERNFTQQVTELENIQHDYQARHEEIAAHHS